MDTTLLYPSKYVSADDLKGRRLTLTIKHLKMELLKQRNGQQEAKPILYFEKTKKGLVVNKTNLKTLQSILGTTDSNKWAGKPIVLYSTPVQFGDEIRQGIRVAAVNGVVSKKAAPVAPVVDPDDDIPGFDIPDGDANEDIPDSEDPFK